MRNSWNSWLRKHVIVNTSQSHTLGAPWNGPGWCDHRQVFFFSLQRGIFGLAQLIGEWMWFFLSKVVPLLEALGAVKHKHIKYHVYDSIVQWASWELVMAPCCWDYLYTIRVTRSDFNNSFTMFFLVERSYFLLTLGVLQRMTFSSLVSLVRRQGSCPHEEMVLYIFWNDAK